MHPIGLVPNGQQTRFTVAEDDGGWCPIDGNPLLESDTELSTSRFQDLDLNARTMLFVPLVGVERLVGLLYFGSRRPNAFSGPDADRAEAFSSNVVFPLQRALLEDELKRLAYTDAQTSLYNHRHFQAQLDEEVQRAQRYGRTVALMLLDIDSFKEFNDKYGHPAGDRVLTQIARAIRANLRTVDIPARYGGEEFVVICPETTKAEAAILAERLCVHVGTTEFEVDGNGPRTVTVSIGVASFPADASNKRELVDAADKALYEAKRAGKNCVKICQAA